MSIISTFPSGNISLQSEGSLSLSASSVSLSISSLSKTVTATRSGDGAVSAVSSKTSVATVSVSGTTITIKAVATGTATITVSVAETSDYTAPASKTISVTVSLPSTTLADNTPATIQATAQAGQAENYWSVGDMIGISLSGTVGQLDLSDTYYAFIIGFNHNSSIEGSNTIHFQFGKLSDGTDIAFADSLRREASSETLHFQMNLSNTSVGGWEACEMRSTICPQFLSAMPTSWQNVIASCTKYTDNNGNVSTAASNVTATTDKIWLLAEYEVYGECVNANSAEQNYQEQYEYYADGNSLSKCPYDDVSTTIIWRLRSPFIYASTVFLSAGASTSGSPPANYSFGFAPGFMVG
ncbi:MAG: Ig-like domain-containing protein [Oscillospiraceae bacterium]|nr:Ig-like domain-containing protein [Oscillospiraceae bacterium]